jgi:hypothetical protein
VKEKVKYFVVVVEENKDVIEVKEKKDLFVKEEVKKEFAEMKVHYLVVEKGKEK